MFFLLLKLEMETVISSRENRTIKRIKNLIRKKKEKRIFLLEGIKIIEEAIASGYNFIYLVISSAFAEKNKKTVSWLKEKNFPCQLVSPKIFSFLSELTTPPGILGLAQVKEYTEIINPDSVFLLIDDLQDPGNLGTIFRLGQGFGVSAIYLSSNSVSPFNSKVIRASMGSVLQVRFFDRINLEEKINQLKQKNVTIYAANPSSGKNIEQVKFMLPLAIVLGNESMGISNKVDSLVHQRMRIPLRNKLDSINVSSAAAIILYQINQQIDF
ncbi:MAG: TrmH family RNA methyltransferase [Candidatus Aminicenantia bacterium]